MLHLPVDNAAGYWQSGPAVPACAALSPAMGRYDFNKHDEDFARTSGRREIDQHDIREQLRSVQGDLQETLQRRIAKRSLRRTVARPDDTRVPEKCRCEDFDDGFHDELAWSSRQNDGWAI